MTNKILTKEILKTWNPCIDGFKRFNELLPRGGSLEVCCDTLFKNGNQDYSKWLFNKAKEKKFDVEFTSKGSRNTGDWNTGDRNTGDWNTGDRNTGDRNTGDWNTGSRNTGDWNTGDWNTGDRNTGFFNVDTPKTIRVFGKDILKEKWESYDKPNFLYFSLTEWVNENVMTDEEKTAHPESHYLGGYLKQNEYKEAFKNSWDNADKKDRARIKDCPNFDADMFFEISGIRVDE